MKSATPQTQSHKSEQAGSTDQIEQTAADLAKKDNRSRVSDQDREQAYRQLQSTAPAPDPKKSAIKPNK